MPVAAGQLWVFTATPTMVLFAQILGVFQKYKNTSKPFKEVPLENVTCIQYRPFEVDAMDGVTCKPVGVMTSRCAQQLLHMVDPSMFTRDADHKSFKFKEANGARLLLNQFIVKMDEYWIKVVKGAEAAAAAAAAQELQEGEDADVGVALGDAAAAGAELAGSLRG